MRALLTIAAGAVAAMAVGDAPIFRGVTWKSFSGSGAMHQEAFIADADVDGIAPKLKLTSPKEGDLYDLQAKLDFTITWFSDSGKAAPKYLIVTFNKQATMSADGTGVAQVYEGKKEVARLDRTTADLSGATQYLSKVTMKVKVVRQKDGQYVAKGTLTSDKLKVTFGKHTVIPTYVQESFTFSGAKPADR